MNVRIFFVGIFKISFIELLRYRERERERDIKMMPCFQERNKKSYFENVTLKYVSKYFKILW